MIVFSPWFIKSEDVEHQFFGVIEVVTTNAVERVIVNPFGGWLSISISKLFFR